MAAKLPDSVWGAIRTAWEYDPDEPSLSVAAERAAKKHKFIAPQKSAVAKRMKADAEAGNPWERRGSLSGINQAAHRKADTLVNSEGEKKQQFTAGDGNSGHAVSTQKEQAARSDSEDLRAEVIARHRHEWRQIVALRQEALQERKTNADLSFTRAKLAKISAEITKIQQDGERKAWGLDEMGDFDPSKLTDEELEAIIRGN